MENAWAYVNPSNVNSFAFVCAFEFGDALMTCSAKKDFLALKACRVPPYPYVAHVYYGSLDVSILFPYVRFFYRTAQHSTTFSHNMHRLKYANVKRDCIALHCTYWVYVECIISCEWSKGCSEQCSTIEIATTLKPLCVYYYYTPERESQQKSGTCIRAVSTLAVLAHTYSHKNRH